MSAQKKIICEGELLKRCRFAWSPRHVCLISGDEDQFDFTLLLYDQRKRKLRKQFSMNEISSVKAGKGNSFHVFLLRRGNPVIQLRSRSEEERANWMALLQVGIGKGNVFHVKTMSKVNLLNEHALAKFVGFANGDSSNRFLHIYDPVTEDPLYIWSLDKIKQFVPTDIGVRMELCERCYRSHSQPNHHTFIVPAFFLEKCLSFFCRETRASIVYVGGNSGLGSGVSNIVYQISSHSCGERMVPPKSPAPPIPPEASLSSHSLPSGEPSWPQANTPVDEFPQYPTLPVRNPVVTPQSDILNVKTRDHFQPIRQPKKIPPPLPPRNLPRFGYSHSPPAYIRPDPTEPYCISRRIFIDDDGKRLNLAHTPRSSVRYPHPHGSSFANILPPRRAPPNTRKSPSEPQSESISSMSQSSDAGQSGTCSVLPNLVAVLAQHQAKWSPLADNMAADHPNLPQSKFHQPSASVPEGARMNENLPIPFFLPGAGQSQDSIQGYPQVSSISSGAVSQSSEQHRFQQVPHMSPQGMQARHAGMAQKQLQQDIFRVSFSTSGASSSIGYESPQTVHNVPVASLNVITNDEMSSSGDATQQLSPQLIHKEQLEENLYYNLPSTSSKMKDPSLPPPLPPRIKGQSVPPPLQVAASDMSKNDSSFAWIPVHLASHTPRRNQTMKEVRKRKSRTSLDVYYDEKASHVGVIQPVFDGYNEAPAKHNNLDLFSGEALETARKPRSHTVDVLVDYPYGDNPLYASQHPPANKPVLSSADMPMLSDDAPTLDSSSMKGDSLTGYSRTGTFGHNADSLLSSSHALPTPPRKSYDQVETPQYQNMHAMVGGKSDLSKEKLLAVRTEGIEPMASRHVSLLENGRIDLSSLTKDMESSSNDHLPSATKPTARNSQDLNASASNLEGDKFQTDSSKEMRVEEGTDKAVYESPEQNTSSNEFDPNTGELVEKKHSLLPRKPKRIAPPPPHDRPSASNGISCVKQGPPIKPKPQTKPKPRPSKQ